MATQKVNHFFQSGNETENAIEKPRPPDEPRLFDYMDLKQVARELGVSQSYVYDLMRGKIKGKPRLLVFKVGRKYYCSVFNLVFWAKSNEGWEDQEARHAALEATRKCHDRVREILAGDVVGGRASEIEAMAKIPNYKV